MRVLLGVLSLRHRHCSAPLAIGYRLSANSQDHHRSLPVISFMADDWQLTASMATDKPV
jgi:hypothetical protein